MANTSTDGVQLKPTGIAAAENVQRLRKLRGLGLRDLERELDAIGHRITLSSLSKIENRARRIDVDDLLALAIVLNVSPVSILLPSTRTASESVEMTGATAAARHAWAWATASQPLYTSDYEEDAEADVREFRTSATPLWLQVLTDVPSDYPSAQLDGVLGDVAYVDLKHGVQTDG